MSGVEHTLLTSVLQDSMAQGEICYLTVSSNSMAPLFRRGDQIAVETVSPRDLQPGDIVVVDDGDGLLTHRYWGSSDGERLVTRGDRTLRFDPLWQQEQLVGRITARRRGSTLSLRQGPGAWLVAHLGRLATLEQQLFAGYSKYPLGAAPAATYLGKQLRQNEQYLPGRLLRRGLRTWSQLITFLVHLICKINRSEANDQAGLRI